MASINDGYLDQKSEPMNAASDVIMVNRFARTLEDAEARRLESLGKPTSGAREIVANRLGVSPGTLENIRRLRTKIVPNWLMNKVRLELIAVLQLEIRRLEHEVHIARQAGADHRDDVLLAAEAQLAKARKALSGRVK